jgi:epoxyqueuosine reductase
MPAYDRFVAAGHHGEMGWLAESRGPRADPGQLLAGARSAIVFAVDWSSLRPPDPGGLTGRVAAYAWGRDYHNLLEKRLRKVAAALRAASLGAYFSIDSRPLNERAWAERAGIGFIGKNCMAILPGSGSSFFIAVLLTRAVLPPDPPLATADRHCGVCRRCLDACPTEAFVEAGHLDARRCISYLTIEHRSPIPLELRPKMGRWVFGCDDCQDVCPHNHHPPEADFEDLDPRAGHAWLDLDWVLREDDDRLLARFEGSPIRRAGAAGLKRNAAVVLGNLGNAAAVPALEEALRHPSPLVTEHAGWALDRLSLAGGSSPQRPATGPAPTPRR